jgi:TfoX C-terminal domain
MPRVAGFDIGRVLVVLFMAWYGFLNLSHPDRWLFLDGVNLIIHEAGHVLWRLFGEFLYFLGGSLTQILVPLVFVVYFWRSSQRFAACVAAFWTASSLFNLSVYIGDARAMELPLLGGDNVEHDWNWILSNLNALGSDHVLSSIVYATGLLYLALSLAGGLYFAKGDGLPLPWEVKRAMKISKMRNLGSKSEAMLAQIGVNSSYDLENLGAVEAFKQLRASDEKVSLVMLYAMHGALTNQAWEMLPPDEKQALKLAVEQ